MEYNNDSIYLKKSYDKEKHHEKSGTNPVHDERETCYAKYITIKKEKEGLLLTIETRIEDESPKKPLKEIVSM